MASINISEKDFEAIAAAAWTAKAAGDEVDAAALDKIGRKMNAALSKASARRTCGPAMGGGGPVRWQDMPSLFAA